MRLVSNSICAGVGTLGLVVQSMVAAPMVTAPATPIATVPTTPMPAARAAPIVATPAPPVVDTPEQASYQNLEEDRMTNLYLDSVQLGLPVREPESPVFAQSQTRERFIRHFESTFRFSYQDNSEFQFPENAHRDWVIELIPFIQLAIGPEPVDADPESEETGLTFSYRPGLRTTVDARKTDISHEIDLVGRWRMGESLARLELSARKIPPGSSDIESAEDPRVFVRAVPSIFWRASPMASFSLRFALEDDYTDSGTKVRGLIDSAVRGEYSYSPKTTLYLAAGAGHFEYSLNGLNLDSQTLRLGARWTATPFLTVTAEAGYVWWEGAEGRSIASEPSCNISLAWAPGPYLHFQAFAQRELRASSGAFGSVYHDSTIGFTATYDIATNYYFTARLNKNWRDYLSGQYDEEFFMRFAAGQYLRFLPEHPSLAELYFRRRDSRFTGQGITANELGISCTFYF